MLRIPKGTFIFCCLMGFVGAAHAASNATVRANGNVLVVNEVPVLEVRASVGGYNPSQRIARALTAIDSLATANDPKVKKVGDDYIIFVSGTHFLSVTKQDARSHRKAQPSLAASWAIRLRNALQLPPVKLSPDSLQIPVGATRLVKMTGSAVQTAEVSTSTDSTVAFERVPGGLKVRAVGPGQGSVVVNAGGVLTTLNVTAKPQAAPFPQTIAAEVVGSPAASSTVRGAIESALKAQLRGANAAKFSYSVGSGTQIGSGEAKTFSVRVRAAAPEAYESVGNVNVVVRNLPAPRKPDSELWYDNSPEIVKRSMPLFSATLEQEKPARLLYHHINGSSQPMYLRVQVVNRSDEPAKVVIIPGDAKPDKNPVKAGLDAADQYFRLWALGSGEVVTIPPQSTLPISFRRLAPGETLSGLCGLRLLAGPKDLLVRTDSWPPYPLESSWQAAAQSSTPWHEVGTRAINDFDRAPFEISEHIYPNPQKLEHVKYEVGGRYGFVRIGQRPIAREDSASHLDGNFGVVYTIKASIENPTNEATDVEVVFETSAGYSGGLFLVNGEVLRTPLMQPKTESQLARYRLTPGASRSLQITTIPLSGSSYPATITIRPVLNEGTARAQRVFSVSK